MYYIILSLFFLTLPVINPDNVKPGDWFVPIDIEADRQYNERVINSEDSE